MCKKKLSCLFSFVIAFFLSFFLICSFFLFYLSALFIVYRCKGRKTPSTRSPPSLPPSLPPSPYTAIFILIFSCGAYPSILKSSNTKSSMPFLSGLINSLGKVAGIRVNCSFKASTWLEYT